MKLVFAAKDLAYPNGLELGVLGFVDNPTSAFEFPAQVFIEVYEGKLRVHVWNGAEDPTTVVIEPLPKKDANYQKKLFENLK